MDCVELLNSPNPALGQPTIKCAKWTRWIDNNSWNFYNEKNLISRLNEQRLKHLLSIFKQIQLLKWEENCFSGHHKLMENFQLTDVAGQQRNVFNCWKIVLSHLWCATVPLSITIIDTHVYTVLLHFIGEAFVCHWMDPDLLERKVERQTVLEGVVYIYLLV